MIRRASNLILTLLAAAVTALGVVGYWEPLDWTINGPYPLTPDWLQTGEWRPGPPTGVGIAFNRGMVWLSTWSRQQRPLTSDELRGNRSPPPMAWPTPVVRRLPCRIESSFMDFRRTDLLMSPPSMLDLRVRLLIMPFWIPSVVLAAYPIALLCGIPRRRRARRLRLGLCLRCGYDLTGNTSGVCPECGATR